jgi:isopentenyl diphosphate isomerase/L-lactate dehydrogenase-like FMN-dependent dehydrogenase
MGRQLQAVSRRRFLEFAAASPCAGAVPALAQNALDPSLIAAPSEALNVFDFEEVAHRKVQPGHWAYMSSGVDSDVTLRANRDGYSHLELRPRRLRDATKVDMRVELFGTTYDSPIFTCPTGGEKSFHPDGELGVARAAKARGTLQILSTSTSTGVEDVNKALGRPVWYQLYAPPSWEACQKILDRVSNAGCGVVLLTVDNTTGRNSETYMRMRPKDLRQCAACHQGPNPGTAVSERRMYDGIDMSAGTQNPAMDWVFLDRRARPGRASC